MTWFKRTKAGIRTEVTEQNQTPEGQWVKCPGCGETVNRRELERQLLVCPKCDHHFTMGSEAYFRMIFDEGVYEKVDTNLVSTDPLGFTDTRPYPVRLSQARKKTGLSDAVQAAVGTVGGHRMSVACMDFSFVGGSMGSVVGEVISRAIRRSYTERIPLLIVTQSGGARMMEGALSLMQLAKTSAHLSLLAEQDVPYFVLLTNPTTGGVTASYAMLGDIHLAEPGALIGFAGPRVIRETMGQDLPQGFQRSEFLRDHGFVDQIVDRRDVRGRIVHLLDLLDERKGD
jgi:acetyl-CoA carboxylase carboxyl transferase subunit beta